MLQAATLTSKGQVTLPVELRRRLGLRKGDRVVFETVGERVFVRKAARVRGQKLSDILRASRPLGMDSVEFQRMLRREWERNDGWR